MKNRIEKPSILRIALACGAFLGFLMVLPVSAATWDGLGDGATWESPNNWNPDGVPGALGNTETAATISGAYNVTLASNVTQGALTAVTVGSASLTMNSGTVLNLTGAISLDGFIGSTGGGLITVNSGSTITHSGTFFMSRILNAANAGTTSLLHFAGGSYSNSNTGSGGRLEIGHGDNMNTAVFEMSGGSWYSSDIAGGGNTNGQAHLIFSGGDFSGNGLRTMSGDASDGYKSMLRVDGSGANSIVFRNNMQVYRHNDNTNGSARVEFITDAGGVTKITVATLNLGATANRKADLYVDTDGYLGVRTLTLFTYTTLQNGVFGSVTVNGAPTLFAGTWTGDVNDLAAGEHWLDYGDGSSADITLFYNTGAVVPEPGTFALLMLGLVCVSRFFSKRK